MHLVPVGTARQGLGLLLTLASVAVMLFGGVPVKNSLYDLSHCLMTKSSPAYAPIPCLQALRDTQEYAGAVRRAGGVERAAEPHALGETDPNSHELLQQQGGAAAARAEQAVEGDGVELQELPHAGPYRLVRVFDRRTHAHPPPPSARARPVLFIPGHLGAFEQARSLGRHLADLDPDGFALYALDLASEPVAVASPLLLRQARFAAAALRTLQQLHGVEEQEEEEAEAEADRSSWGMAQRNLAREDKNAVLVVGHSFGGIVARAAQQVQLEPGVMPPAMHLLTLSAPHARAPVLLDRGMSRIYATLSHAQRLAFFDASNASLASFASVPADDLPPHANRTRLWLSRTSRSLSLRCLDALNASIAEALEADHNAALKSAALASVGALPLAMPCAAVASQRSALLELSAGASDGMVASGLNTAVFPSAFRPSSLALDMYALPQVKLTCDHLAQVWCHQVLAQVVRVLQGWDQELRSLPPQTSPEEVPPLLLGRALQDMELVERNSPQTREVLSRIVASSVGDAWGRTEDERHVCDDRLGGGWRCFAYFVAHRNLFALPCLVVSVALLAAVGRLVQGSISDDPFEGRHRRLPTVVRNALPDGVFRTVTCSVWGFVAMVLSTAHSSLAGNQREQPTGMLATLVQVLDQVLDMCWSGSRHFEQPAVVNNVPASAARSSALMIVSGLSVACLPVVVDFWWWRLARPAEGEGPLADTLRMGISSIATDGSIREPLRPSDASALPHPVLGLALDPAMGWIITGLVACGIVAAVGLLASLLRVAVGDVLLHRVSRRLLRIEVTSVGAGIVGSSVALLAAAFTGWRFWQSSAVVRKFSCGDHGDPSLLVLREDGACIGVRLGLAAIVVAAALAALVASLVLLPAPKSATALRDYQLETVVMYLAGFFPAVLAGLGATTMALGMDSASASSALSLVSLLAPFRRDVLWILVAEALALVHVVGARFGNNGVRLFSFITEHKTAECCLQEALSSSCPNLKVVPFEAAAVGDDGGKHSTAEQLPPKPQGPCLHFDAGGKAVFEEYWEDVHRVAPGVFVGSMYRAVSCDCLAAGVRRVERLCELCACERCSPGLVAQLVKRYPHHNPVQAAAAEAAERDSLERETRSRDNPSAIGASGMTRSQERALRQWGGSVGAIVVAGCVAWLATLGSSYEWSLSHRFAGWQPTAGTALRQMLSSSWEAPAVSDERRVEMSQILWSAAEQLKGSRGQAVTDAYLGALMANAGICFVLLLNQWLCWHESRRQAQKKASQAEARRL